MILPEKQKTYKKVFELACTELKASPLQERLAKASLRYTAGDGYSVQVPFFNEAIVLQLPACTFSSQVGANVTLAAKILVLHYINKASGQELSDEKIPYEDIPGCRVYQPVFEKRVIRPLISAFGFNRDLFKEAARLLGATQEEYGDASFTLHAFPKVPITVILWEGDQEFPPSLKVLFDPSINTYLPLEDVTVISKLAATRILKAARLTHSE